MYVSEFGYCYALLSTSVLCTVLVDARRREQLYLCGLNVRAYCEASDRFDYI